MTSTITSLGGGNMAVRVLFAGDRLNRTRAGEIYDEHITVPGTDAKVMGPYYIRGEYADKATFEARGLRK